MIEKRTFWIVESYDQEIESVAALYDTASNMVLTYKYSDDTNAYFRSPRKDMKFYETQEEAATALEEHRKYLREMMPKVKEFLDEIEGMEPTDEFTFERRDYLPDNMLYYEDNYLERYRRQSKIVSILTTVCRQQKLCINGCTFPLNLVRRVNWNYMKAELVLSDGSFGSSSTVTTHTREEFEAIKILFGENTSDAVCNR